ncbi:signal peptidase I [Undibacter mobilis]|uniref:Signal peptidase I n=1 Tax=Undibacter mobilis TaxID=2292256 RepID=A0A371B807_9BRAD|nr:signal peptidase I [Undibacter mobilis]RDV03662.1 signal peptidase I [Undibacter mobilis]
MSETSQAGTKPSRARALAKGIVDIVSILLVVTVAKTALAEPFYVPSGSMEPTLMIGDELLATKFAYGYSTASLPSFVSLPQSERLFGALPKRGDVVVFRWPGDRSQAWVKRVIALPGDHVRLERGTVFINGEAATLTPDGIGQAENEDGSQAPAARYIETLPGGRKHIVFKLTAFNPLDNMSDTVVPAGHVFVMGDNRDNSADSRVALKAGGVGMLPTANLIGRVDAIVGSWDLGMKNQPVWTWPKGLRLSRFFSGVE